MHVLGVVGATGTGTTATTVDLAAALRRAGRHAAVLDVSGDVAALFDVDVGATFADALAGDATPGEAATTVDLPHGDVADALSDYADGLGNDPTAFRASAQSVSPGEPEPGELPIVVGGDRAAVGEVDDETLDAALADLAFAYDYLIADAGTLGPSIARLPDGVVAVTDTSEESVETAREGIVAYAREGLTVVGAVVNRAGERTDVSALADRLGVTVLAVVPADDRTPTIEPIAFTAPETPAAAAYERLAATVAAWDGSAGLVDGGPGGAVVTDGDGPDDGDTAASEGTATSNGTTTSEGADASDETDDGNDGTGGGEDDGGSGDVGGGDEDEGDDGADSGLFDRLTGRFR